VHRLQPLQPGFWDVIHSHLKVQFLTAQSTWQFFLKKKLKLAETLLQIKHDPGQIFLLAPKGQNASSLSLCCPTNQTCCPRLPTHFLGLNTLLVLKF